MVDAEVAARSKYVLHSVRTHQTTGSKSNAMKKMGGERKEALNFKDLMLSVCLCIELRVLYMRQETKNLVNCPIKGICKPAGCSR
jgi:hypothetical protein